MANVTLHINSNTQDKTVLIKSTDNYNVKEKIEISSLKDTDSVLISTVEFSEITQYRNTINLTLTKQEFNQFMTLAKNLFD